MLNGLIVYSFEDANKNQWFIDYCLKELNDNCFSLFYKEEKEVLPYLETHKIDFVIYRGRDYKVLEALEKQGIKCFNNSQTNKIANDKHLSYFFFQENGFPTLETSLEKGSLEYPFIMKSLNGHGGQEVYLINDDVEEKSVIKKSQKPLLYQRYIPNCSDVRLYILNSKVVGAVKRNNAADFRSNFSLGGQVEEYQPTKEMVGIALKISSLLNAIYLGVDFLLAEDQIFVNEIEDPVGARMLYKTAGIDIVKLYIEEIKSQLK